MFSLKNKIKSELKYELVHFMTDSFVFFFVYSCWHCAFLPICKLLFREYFWLAFNKYTTYLCGKLDVKQTRRTSHTRVHIHILLTSVELPTAI